MFRCRSWDHWILRRPRFDAFRVLLTLKVLVSGDICPPYKLARYQGSQVKMHNVVPAWKSCKSARRTGRAHQNDVKPSIQYSALNECKGCEYVHVVRKQTVAQTAAFLVNRALKNTWFFWPCTHALISGCTCEVWAAIQCSPATATVLYLCILGT